MGKSIITMVFIVILLGAFSCSKKVKKAPATTESKKSEQSMVEETFPDLVQADEDFSDDSESDDDEYTTDDDNSSDDDSSDDSDDDSGIDYNDDSDDESDTDDEQESENTESNG